MKQYDRVIPRYHEDEITAIWQKGRLLRWGDSMKPYRTYSSDEETEVLSALATIKGQKNSISKSAMWTEIDTHPERYPVLASRAPKRVLCIISYVMNDRYEMFAGTDTGRLVRNAVWELNRQKVTA